VRTAGLLAAGAVGAPPGGIWFIDLSEQRTREGMVQAMAQVLDLSLQDCTTSEAALSQLQQAIAQRGHSWLILDNLEQLVDVAREMVDHLGSAAPEIRWLLTSREHLGLPEEEVLSLGPLPAADVAQLFLDHAIAIRPDLVPSPALREVAESICTAVDGIPLAIELAAARARILAPAQILDRLSEALQLLAAPNRKGPARHSTLRATLGWSWDLLTPSERTCLAQLSVFHGGFTADAAEAVVQPSEGPDAPWTVDLLEALVDQSLLHPMPALGDARLTMYRSVQEFAQEKLAMGGKEEAAARHLHWAITEGERRLGQQWTSKEPEATQALRHERDNLFAAHAAASSPDAIIRTALVLAHLLWSTGPRSTLARVLQNAEGVCSEAPELAAKVGLQQGLLLHQSGQTEAGEALLLATLQHVRATGDLGLEASILRALADLNYDQADYAEAQSQFERAAELSGQAGDRGLQGNHLTTVGNLHRLLNRTEQARDCLERGLAIHREVGDQRSEATALVGLASLASLLGAEKEALSRNEQALQIFHAIGDARGESYLLENLGNLHTSAGRSDEAMAAYERAMDIAQSRGMILHQAAIATNLAMAHLDVGELAEAEDLLRQALLAHRSHGRRLYEGAAMIRLAMVLLDRGRHDPAQPLLDGAVEILEQIGAPRYAAYGQAWRGLCRALEGKSTEAEADIAAAEQALGEAGDALGQTLCDLLRGHLRPGTAGGLIARAQALGPPSGDHPSGSPAPAARSVEIRLAIRLLERRSG
jgi:predicted ATPase/Tfp pilus assembly protein PilF